MIYKRLMALVLAFSAVAGLASCGNTAETQVVMKYETHSVQDNGIEEDENDVISTETTEADTSDAENTTETVSEAEAESTSESKKTDDKKKETDDNSAYVKGNIYGSDGSVIVYSVTDEEGNVKRVFSDAYAVSHANIISELAGGLDSVLDEQLKVKNPEAVNDHESVGQSIQLTIDPKIQTAIYNYMSYYNIEGSVVVMRTDGSIASEVSYPSFDPGYYVDNPDEVLPLDKYENKAMKQELPGSCFKIMSEVLADKHGIYNLPDEGTWTYETSTIMNWDHEDEFTYPVENRTLFSAFLNSSNIYFAKTFDKIGYDDVLNDLAGIFNFGDHDDDNLGLDNPFDIECDFGTLMNNIEFYCLDDLRRSAFGQSYVKTTPVYLAALAREAVFGDMVKPFVVKNIINTNNTKNIIQHGSMPYNYICSIPYEYRQKLLDGMLAVASNVGLPPFDNYTVYAKTGTAEKFKGDEHLNDILYITGVIQNCYDTNNVNETVYKDYEEYKATGSYAVVMQITNPEYFDFDFASESTYLYQGILNLIIYN